MQLSKYAIIYSCLAVAILSTTEANAQREVRIIPIEVTKEGDTMRFSTTIIGIAPPDASITNKKLNTYTYWKDTLYTTTARVPADLFIEPYKLKEKISKPFKSYTEIGYAIDLETNDTSRAYGDGADDKMVFDKQMRYLHHYLLFPITGTTRDSAYLVCNYYYTDDKILYKEHFNIDGTYSARQEYKYDTLGNLVYENYVVTDENGKAILKPNSSSQTLYQYHNDTAITIREFVYNEDAQAFVLSQTHKIFLDDKKRIIHKDIWDNMEDRQAYLISFSYPDALETQQISNSYGTTYYYQYKYNKNKELIESKSGNSNSETNIPSVTTYQYKYDKNGNWIQCYSEYTLPSYNNETPQSYLEITKRIITY